MNTNQMTAGLMYGPRNVRIEDVPIPKLDSTEVLVQVEAVGICATDVKKYTGVSSCSFPIILGHEFSGAIISVGNLVKDYKIGDRVSANPDIPCFQCRYCYQSKFNLCTRLSVIGYGTEEIEPVNGAFAQFVKVPTWNLIRLEDSINYDDATYIEPLACVVRSFKQGQVNVDDTVVILGEGRIGLLHTQLAKVHGAEKIIVTGLMNDRLSIAKELGAHETINVKDTEPINFVYDNTLDGANVVFDTTGNVAAAEQGVKMLAPHGRFISFAGFPKDSIMKIDPRELHYKEIILTGSFGYGSIMDYYTAGHLITTRRINVHKITTQKRPLEGLEEGLIEISELKSIRTIIRPNS